MKEKSQRPARGNWLCLSAAAAMACLALPAHSAKVTATADIKGCTDAGITGSATLTEEKTEEGIKEVTIHLKVRVRDYEQLSELLSRLGNVTNVIETRRLRQGS